VVVRLEAQTLEERADVLGRLALALRPAAAVVGGVDADEVARDAHDLGQLVGRHDLHATGPPRSRPGGSPECGGCPYREAPGASGSKICPIGSRFSAWNVSSARPYAQYAESDKRERSMPHCFCSSGRRRFIASRSPCA